MAETLPTELIEEIFSHAAHIDRSTCRSISLTNKLGHRVATPVLYATIGVLAPENEVQLLLSAVTRMKTLSCLCRSLLENRALARYVTAVQHYADNTYDLYQRILEKRRLAPCMTDDGSIPGFDNLNDGSYDLSDFDEFIDIDVLSQDSDTGRKLRKISSLLIFMAVEKESIPLPDHELFRKLIYEELPIRDTSRDKIRDLLPLPGFQETEMSETLYLALFVLACPLVKNIEVQGCSPEFDHCFWMLEEMSISDAGQDRRVRDITDLHITNTDNYDGIAGELHMLLTLPGLRTVLVSGLTNAVDEANWSSSVQSDVSELIIDNCSTHGDWMAILVRACSQLKRLDISWKSGHSLIEDITVADHLFSALAQLPLLEELRLEMQPDSRKVDHDGASLKSRRQLDLRSLQHLHTLTIPDFFLFGIDYDNGENPWLLDGLLPASTKKLEIVDSQAGICHQKLDLKELTIMPEAARFDSLTIFNSDKSQILAQSSSKENASNIEVDSQPLVSISGSTKRTLLSLLWKA